MLAMATIIIRNLDERVAERLKLQAKFKGVSVEEEARRLLAEGTQVSRKELAEQARAMRARLKFDPTPAADYIREDRDR
jgi:plasmid stability protein